MSDAKYLQLARSVEAAIDSGQLTRGSRLPSVREVMQQHSVSLATVTSAYRWLEQKGLIEARQKSGYFVRQRVDTSVPVHTKPVRRSNAPWSAPAELYPQQRLQRLMATSVRRYPALHTDYNTDAGLVRLRVELARRSAEFGCFLRADQILVTHGATEALALALRATTNAGDAVAITQPAHPLFMTMLASLQLQPAFITCALDASDFIEHLERLRQQHPSLRACLLMTNFEFPSGRLMPLAVKRALSNWAAHTGIAIIEDDVFGDLQHDGPRPLPLKSFDTDGNIIYVNSCSKSTAPGLRLGWIAAGRWHDTVTTLKHAHASSASALAQSVLHDFLAQGSHLPHLRKLRQTLRERCNRLNDALTSSLQESCRWQPPRGGFAFWVELPATVDGKAMRATLDTTPVDIAHWIDGNDRGFFLNGALAWSDQQHQQLQQIGSTVQQLAGA